MCVSPWVSCPHLLSNQARRALDRKLTTQMEPQKYMPGTSSTLTAWGEKLNFLSWTPSVLSRETRYCFSADSYHDYSKAWWWFSVAGIGRLVKIEEGKNNIEKYKEVLEENVLQSAHSITLGQNFTFHHDNKSDNGFGTSLCLWMFLGGSTKAQTWVP